MFQKLGMATIRLVLMVSFAFVFYILLTNAFVKAEAAQVAFYNVCIQSSEGENIAGWAWSAKRTNQAGDVLEEISGTTGSDHCSSGNFGPGTWTFEAGAARAKTPATLEVQAGSVYRWDFIYDSTSVGELTVKVTDQVGNPSPRLNVTVTSSSGFEIPGFTIDGIFTATVKYGEAKVQVDGFPEKVVNIGQAPALVELQKDFPYPGGEWMILDYRGVEAPGKQKYGIRVDKDIFSPLGWDCRIYYPGHLDGEVGGCVSEKEDAHLIILEPGLQEIQLVGKQDGIILVITTTVDVQETPAMLFQETGKVDDRGAEVQFWLDKGTTASKCSLTILELQQKLEASPCPTDPRMKWSVFLQQGDWLTQVRLEEGTPQEVVFYILVPVVIVKEQEESLFLFMPFAQK